MSRFSALLDACTLVPLSVADTLLRLAETGLYRPLWSDKILGELAWSIDHVRPDLPPGSGARRTRTMRTHFIDALVEDWESLVESVSLPDRDDRHVVAAAIRGRADVIVTDNLRDFPADALGPHDLTAVSVD